MVRKIDLAAPFKESLPNLYKKCPRTSYTNLQVWYQGFEVLSYWVDELNESGERQSFARLSSAPDFWETVMAGIRDHHATVHQKPVLGAPLKEVKTRKHFVPDVCNVIGDFNVRTTRSMAKRR